MGLLDRLLRRDQSLPLRGAPAVRRQKTYSAQSGFVYQYFYEGYREAGRARRPGHDYVFRITRDRQSFFPVTVFLPAAASESWQSSHGRSLTLTEQYAVVKMSLFEAFEGPQALGPGPVELEVDAAGVAAHLQTLDIE